MKKVILLSSLLLASNAFADQLHNYNDIKAAATTGKSIHFVADFSQCTTSNKNAPQTMMAAVYTPNEMSVTDDHLAASLTHFTLNNPAYPNKAIYEFVRYTMTSDNNLAVDIQELDASTYAPLGDKLSFSCKLDTGVKVYA